MRPEFSWRTPLPVVIIVSLVYVLSSCSGHGSGAEISGDTLTERASFLTLVNCGEYVIADFPDPWNSKSTPRRLLLVPHNTPVPDGFEDATLVRVPLRNSAVFSTVHTAAVNELGALGAVSAVADAAYIAPDDPVYALLESGKVKDVGASQAPSQEVLLDLDPDAVLLSPFQNSGLAGLEGTGIPLVPMADYMENTPLGRAEWILLLGELYGQRDKARAVYDRVVNEYLALAQQAAGVKERPVVLVENVYSGVWAVPGGKSYRAQMLRDAGASYPWADNKESGSLQLSAEAVLDAAQDARFWLVSGYGHAPTRRELAQNTVLAPEFRAWKEDGIYALDSKKHPVYAMVAFHPEKVLREYISIFHPELQVQPAPQLYVKAE
ncbi:MAG: ABC transporter substrate-binding protein [Muribaculaceae bacterium]|nr:ABC transporter substrate-binding protein [Muribaculaceae bacterium]